MEDAAHTLEVLAPAKINLGLEVLRRRPDGYHDLITLYQTVGLWDEVVLRFGGPSGVRLKVTPPNLDLGPDEANLAVRAARLFPQVEREGISIALTKRIPAGAGLGGGSSDAAAVLFALGQRTGVSRDELHAMAASLGSDVSFFLEGGTQLGLGRGEELLPLEPLPPAWVLLIYPGFQSETRQVFGGLNLTLTRRGPLFSFAERFAACCSDSDGTIEQALFGERAFDRGAEEGERQSAPSHLRFQEALLALLHNDLEATATALNPALSELIRESKRLGVNARVTGSGSCLFALAPTRNVGRAWCAHLRSRLFQEGNGWVRLVRTVARGCSLKERQLRLGYATRTGGDL